MPLSRMNIKSPFTGILTAAIFLIGALLAPAQKPNERDKQKVRTVTVPISIYTKKELDSDQPAEYIEADRIVVKEDKEEQAILSIRSVNTSPLALAVLIQEELTSNVNLELPQIAKFIRGLPKGSRVMVAYIRGGSLVTRQKFTDDLEKAAKTLGIVSGSSSPSGNGPYEGVGDAVGKFEGLPGGRRAVLLISDGLDASLGVTGASPSQSLDLDRAIAKAQKRSVAVYSIYSPTALTSNRGSLVSLAAQGALERLSEETGGRAFYQGSLAPVSFDPFLKDLGILISRQFALTYLSTHMNKGYHKLEVTSTNPAVKIQYPRGYFYR